MTDHLDVLDRMAQRFERAEQRARDEPRRSGWGQFLDAPRWHYQIGMYGTSAGAIVLALADRKDSALSRDVAALLEHWWEERNRHDAYAHSRLVQIPRLAIFHLAARVSPLNSNRKLAAEVGRALIDALLPAGIWGNYWVCKRHHDQSPRLFPTALALLSFTLFRSKDDPVPEELPGVAEELERRIRGAHAIPAYVQAVAGAAILSIKGAGTSRPLLARLTYLARARPLSLQDERVYFYDYEHYPETDDELPSARDYIVISTELMLAIAGLHEEAPGTLRLRSERTVAELVKHCRANDGVFLPSAGERISTMNQGWAAILLAAPHIAKTHPGFGSRIWYGLIRHRTDGFWTGTALPLFSTTCVTVLAVLGQLGSASAKVVAAVSVLLIGAIHGPKAVERIIAPLLGRGQ